MRKKKGFEDKLGLDEEVEPVSLEEVNVVSHGSMEDTEEDYEMVRRALVTTIVRSSEIIDEAAIAIKQAPNGMMVKSFADLVKSMKDSTMGLLEMHKEIRKLQEIKQEEQKPEDKKTVKTNLTEIIQLAKEREKRAQ